MGHATEEMTSAEIREALIAKIRAIGLSGRLMRELEKSFVLASNDDLRKYLAVAEISAEIGVAEPVPYVAPDESSEAWPLVSDDAVQERTGAELEPHTYALAKDTFINYKGPDWCPVNLWSAYKHGVHGVDPKLTRECAKKLIYSTGASDIWRRLAERYVRPDRVALTLPSRCADFMVQWSATPKRTPKQHKMHRLALKKMTEELSSELDGYFDSVDSPYALQFFRGMNFTQLMSTEQLDVLDMQLKWHNHLLANQVRTEENVQRHHWDASSISTEQTWELLLSHDPRRPGIVPTLQEMLRMVGEFFAKDGDVSPIERPNSRNIGRNYFARRLIQYFNEVHGDMSPVIVADITTIFFPQGITDNEVSKQAGRDPGGRKHAGG